MRLIEKQGKIEIWAVQEKWGADYYVYGVTQNGAPRVVPSLGMAREVVARASAAPRPRPPRAPVGPPAPASETGTLVRKTQNPRRVALYLRVSTDEQTTENQERELRQVAERAGWEIVAVFRDEGISGSKGREHRPGFDAMLNAAVRREFDLLAAWSVDRLGRSIQDLVVTLNELRAVNCDLFLLRQNVDTTTPTGRAMFQMLGVFAEFEREMIRERVKSGMARAKAKGQRFGRPPVSLEKQEAIRVMLRGGTGVLKTARLNGVGTFTVQRIKQEMAST